MVNVVRNCLVEYPVVRDRYGYLQDTITDDEADTQAPGYVPGRRRAQQHQEQAQQNMDPDYEDIEDQFLSSLQTSKAAPSRTVHLEGEGEVAASSPPVEDSSAKAERACRPQHTK